MMNKCTCPYHKNLLDVVTDWRDTCDKWAFMPIEELIEMGDTAYYFGRASKSDQVMLVAVKIDEIKDMLHAFLDSAPKEVSQAYYEAVLSWVQKKIAETMNALPAEKREALIEEGKQVAMAAIDSMNTIKKPELDS